ncbi:site-specific integrase [Listeria monocytogenes]|nr:site-specific integrase [Listeria monocytogenes]
MANIVKTETGWKYRVSYKEAGKYKVKSKSGFPTKKQALLAASEMEEKLHRGVDINAGEANFVEAFKEWYTTFRKQKKSIENDKHYDYAIKFCEKYFVGLKINDVNRTTYQKAINDFAKTHAKETTRKRHVYVRSFIREMVYEGVILRDPTARVIIPDDETTYKDLKALSEEQVKKLVKELNNHFNPAHSSISVILFAIASGARFSEIIGLTWDCIDFVQKTIKINKTWDYKDTNTFSNTKNYSSNRIITIDDSTLSMLNKIKVYQSAEKLKDSSFNKNKLVFINTNSIPPSNNAINKSLRRYCTNLGINNAISVHGLRHTHATLLLYNDCNIKYLSKRLGHNTIVTTLETYSHVIDEMEQKESYKVNELMNKINEI